ncbi:MAG: glycosyl hydrolase [Syntrophales bacterium]|jgi:hypothetical protein
MKRSLFPLLMMLAVWGCSSLPIEVQEPAKSPAAPPAWGFALDGYPITDGQLQEVQNETGLSAQIVVFFLQWPQPGIKDNVFPRESMDAIRTRGAIPCLTWEPMYYHQGKEIMIPHEDILNGRYDSYIAKFARESKLWGKPFMVRFAHEMNISRYHWGTDKEGFGPQSPYIYKKMFRYVAAIFKKEKADNVFWAFCPNSESLPHPGRDKGAEWNTLSAYYPGDDWVDIVGIDGYNWGTSQKKSLNGWDSSWRSFREIFGAAYQELRALASGKPLFIFETASVTAGGDRPQWISAMLETAKGWNIAGVCWFQVHKDNDWRINSDGDRDYVSLIHRVVAPSLTPSPPRPSP